MAVMKLDRSDWKNFLDRMSKGLVGKQVEIEVASLSLGSQIEAEWLPLLGIAYDHKDDLLEIALDGLDHLIRHPSDIDADMGPAGLDSLLVIDGEGVSQIIRLRDPLMLPAPSTAA